MNRDIISLNYCPHCGNQNKLVVNVLLHDEYDTGFHMLIKGVPTYEIKCSNCYYEFDLMEHFKKVKVNNDG